MKCAECPMSFEVRNCPSKIGCQLQGGALQDANAGCDRLNGVVLPVDGKLVDLCAERPSKLSCPKCKARRLDIKLVRTWQISTYADPVEGAALGCFSDVEASVKISAASHQPAVQTDDGLARAPRPKFRCTKCHHEWPVPAWLQLVPDPGGVVQEGIANEEKTSTASKTGMAVFRDGDIVAHKIDVDRFEGAPRVYVMHVLTVSVSAKGTKGYRLRPVMELGVDRLGGWVPQSVVEEHWRKISPPEFAPGGDNWGDPRIVAGSTVILCKRRSGSFNTVYDDLLFSVVKLDSTCGQGVQEGNRFMSIEVNGSLYPYPARDMIWVRGPLSRSGSEE